MKKILISVFSIAVVGAVAFGATQAFFSDKETSTGNRLEAGSLDLKIDNTCYYNQQACTKGFFGGVPNASPSANATNQCTCTWQAKDLAEGDTFFNLADLKPGDQEEDTISLRVTNDAWVCMENKITQDSDNDCTNPELKDDPQCGKKRHGDLGPNLHFVFWHDDGDNVLEQDEEESAIVGTATDLLNKKITLADSGFNLWGEGGPKPGPLDANKTYFVGKAFCFGDLTLKPVPDNKGVNPTVDPGILCNGEPVNNAAQTDSILADIEFRAVQARHNKDFLCNPPEPTATPTASPSPTPSPTPSPNPTPTPTR